MPPIPDNPNILCNVTVYEKYILIENSLQFLYLYFIVSLMNSVCKYFIVSAAAIALFTGCTASKKQSAPERNGEVKSIILRHDLSGTDLSGMDLSGANLSGKNLRGASLAHALLRNTDLSGTDLRGAVLNEADLTGADLSGADLTGASMRNARMRGTDFTDAIMIKVDLTFTNIRSVRFRGASLGGAIINRYWKNKLQSEQVKGLKSVIWVD